MAGSVSSDPRLEVSVSFGRFENDALSWEKWSSFSQNKYLEEVGSLSTPGSVAQKKAYFEAHYKKIAARKAEQLELENSKDLISPSEDDQTTEDLLENDLEISFGSDVKFEMRNGGNSVAENICRTALTNDTIVKGARDEDVKLTLMVEQGDRNNGLMDVTTLEEEKDDDDDDATAVESLDSILQEAWKDVSIPVVDPELQPNEEPVLVGEHIPQSGPQEFVEQTPESKNKEERLTGLNQDYSKFNPPKVAQKVTPNKMERNLAGAKKKVVTAVMKASQSSRPKSSFNSTHMSASQSGKNKVNKSPMPKSKNTLLLESKRAAPTSLHMSLSLGPAKSSAVFSMTRKSLIMEKMGDKDIVKRAFKSFHNQTNGYPIDEKSSALKQVLSTTFETKISPSLTPRKENKGLTKVVEKCPSRSNNPGHQLKHFSSGKNTTTVSPSLGLKSDERAEKRKEFVRSLGAKSMAREAENVQLSTKSKEEKESDIRKPRQTLNFKATPLPSFYRSQAKKPSEKEVAGSKTIHHQPGSLNR